MNQDESNALESLRRATTQRKVLLLLIQEGREITSQYIAKNLNLTVNAVNIALHNLHNKGLVERVSRGIYNYKLGPILAVLAKKYLEEG